MTKTQRRLAAAAALVALLLGIMLATTDTSGADTPTTTVYVPTPSDLNDVPVEPTPVLPRLAG